MTTHQDLLSGLDKIADEGLNELLRRVQDINNSYRAVAEKMGQLYMCADELQLTALTRDPVICVRATPPTEMETCGAAIMQPATGQFWAVQGLPTDNDYARFTL